MLTPNNNSFIQIQIPVPRAICRLTFLLKIIMAFSIIYFTHYFTLKSLKHKQSSRLNNNSILVNNGRNSFEALLHGAAFYKDEKDDLSAVKRRHKKKSNRKKSKWDSDEPGASNNDNEGFGSSENENSDLIDGWRQAGVDNEDYYDENDANNDDAGDLDKFDPENYETDEDYGDGDDDMGVDEEEEEDEDENDENSYRKGKHFIHEQKIFNFHRLGRFYPNR